MKVIVTGGGTGGHIYAAVAIARKIMEKDPGTALLFVGSEYGPEAGSAKAAGYPFVGLPVRGMVGRSRVESLKSLLLFARATVSCRKVFKGFDPDCVVGTGGYASAPACLYAVLRRVPLVLFEMNRMPGIVVKALAGRASVVALAIEDAREGLSKRADVRPVGMVVRPEIEALADERNRAAARSEGFERFGLEAGKSTLLVIGGSQGSEAVNRAVWEMRPPPAGGDVQILHLTGRGYEQDDGLVVARDGFERSGLVYRAVPYTEEVYLAFAVADLALARAGAGTVAELLAAAVPSVLVPFPHATGGHQMENARQLADEGAAVLVPQQGESAAAALQEAVKVIGDAGALAAMREACVRSYRGGGAAGVAELVEVLTSGSS